MIEHVLSPYPEKFCKLKKEAPALSASNRLSGKVLPFLCIRKAFKCYCFLLYIYSSSFFLYLRYKLTPIAVPAAAMIITTYTAGP